MLTKNAMFLTMDGKKKAIKANNNNANLRKKNSSQPAYFFSEWDPSNADAQYYRTCVITVFNATGNEISEPEIQFNMNPNVMIQVNEGFIIYGEDNEGRITGGLQSYKQPVPAGGSVSFSLGVNNGSGDVEYFDLPSKFSLDGVLCDTPNDTVPPTVPSNIKLVSSGSSSLSINWDESTDLDTLVTHYKIVYETPGDSPHETKSNTNSAQLSNLRPSSSYSVKVSAVDLAGNESAFSNPVIFSTSEPLPDLGDFNIRSAPFIDFTAYEKPSLEDLGNIGLQGIFLGFLVVAAGDPSNTVYWGGYQDFGDARTSDFGKDEIDRLRALGKDAIFSFGGASNHPLEAAETDINKIISTYNDIIHNYGITYIDFDFEGSFMHDTEGQNRHIAAITQVIKDNPGIKISYTLPVDGNPGSLEGFNDGGRNFLKNLSSNGIQPSLINGMLMEFGQGSPSDAYECCVYGLNGMFTHIKEAFPSWSDSKIWRRIGACPMFGRHINNKLFSRANQLSLNQFCHERGIGCMSGWDATRDANQGTSACNPPSNDPGQNGDLYKCTYADYPGNEQEPLDFSKILANYQG